MGIFTGLKHIYHVCEPLTVRLRREYNERTGDEIAFVKLGNKNTVKGTHCDRLAPGAFAKWCLE